jgi:hypothetical protein
MSHYLSNNNFYSRLRRFAEDDTEVLTLASTVTKVWDQCEQITKSVIQRFPEYTLHDVDHVAGVLEAMSRLVPDNVLQGLPPLETAAVIMSAALHDIGMAPRREYIEEITAEPRDKTATSVARREFLVFCEGYPSVRRRMLELESERRLLERNELEAYLLREYIRSKHAERTKGEIFNLYEREFVYGGFSFAARLAEVCASHAEDPSRLANLNCHELVRSPGEYANWRFVAVLLRLADALDFGRTRAPSVLFEQLGVRDAVSVAEWQKLKSVNAWEIRPERIALSARCPDPVVEKGLRDYVRKVEAELRAARGVLGSMQSLDAPGLSTRYDLQLPESIDITNVGPLEGPAGPLYRYLDLGFKLDDESIMSLVMGVSLYGDEVLFLRELLQNAVDTCRLRQSLCAAAGSVGYEPCVDVALTKEDDRWFLTVEDNGMGMDETIVACHLARVGRSYYRSSQFLQERARAGIAFEPVSMFGIGILSVFMVADLMQIETRSLSVDLITPGVPLEIEVSGPNKLFWFKPSRRKSFGTSIRLRLAHFPFASRPAKGQAVNAEKAATQELAAVVSRLAPHSGIPIRVRGQDTAWPIAESWSAPEPWAAHGAEFSLDLSGSGVSGIRGKVGVVLLQRSGVIGQGERREAAPTDFAPIARYKTKFSAELDIDEPRQSDLVEEGLRHYVRHDFGRIVDIEQDYSEREGGVSEPTSTAGHSMGRWSQRGFAVPMPLFAEYESWDVRGPVGIRYPFPVVYDLDLSGPFALRLTADRTRYVVDEVFSLVERRIRELVTKMLLEKLGKSIVMDNKEFFEEVVGSDSKWHVEAREFMQVLAEFVSHTK